MNREEISRALDEITQELSAPDESGLASWYPAKRKQPDSRGRQRLMWCWVRRDALTDTERHALSAAAIRKGNFAEAQGLLAERDLIDVPTQWILDLARSAGQ